jgi:hypothetical protein
MNATLEIDDDVFAAADRLAAEEATTIGKVISGVTEFAWCRAGGRPVTNETVQELMEPRFCPKTGLWDI